MSTDTETPPGRLAQCDPHRVTALVLVMVFHVVLFGLLVLPARPHAPREVVVDPDLARTQVTFITHDTRPPPPPPPAAKAVATPAPTRPDPQRQVEVATPDEVGKEDGTLADSQDPEGEGDGAGNRLAGFEEAEFDGFDAVSRAFFDAMAAGAEPAPDLPAVEQTVYRTTHPPRFPREARLAGESGWVILRVLVDESGFPVDFLVDPRTTATPALIEAAIAAVEYWRFHPALKSGAPVRAWLEVPIGFFNSRKPSPQQESKDG